MDKQLAQAFQAGMWAREAGREPVSPTYAPNAIGKPQRDAWGAGYMSLGPLPETKRKGK